VREREEDKRTERKGCFDLEAGSTIYVDARVRRGGPDEYRPIDQRAVGVESECGLSQLHFNSSYSIKTIV